VSADCISCGREWHESVAGVTRCPACAELGGMEAGDCPSRLCDSKPLRGVVFRGLHWLECSSCNEQYTPSTIRRLRVGEALDFP
jgi:hypothetical protein